MVLLSYGLDWNTEHIETVAAQQDVYKIGGLAKKTSRFL